MWIDATVCKLQELYDKYKDKNFVIIRLSGQQLHGAGTGQQRRDCSVLFIEL